MKKKIILLILSISIAIIVLVGTTYAVLFKTYKTGQQTYTTGILEISSEVTNESLTLTNSFPISDENALKLTPYTFKIKNTGNLTYKFDVKLLSNTSENQISSNYIKVKVYDDEISTLASLTDGIILSEQTLNPGYSIDVILWVWLDEYTPNTELGKQFNGKIATEGQAIYTIDDYAGELVYNMVKDHSVMDNVSSKYVTSSSGINFYDVSSDVNGKGVYTLSATDDDEYPVHYYRGNVVNNNILFANYCWKIIRTTNTGGTKLIYNGSPVDGKCNNSGADTFTHLGISYGVGNDGLSSGGYSFTEQSLLDMAVTATSAMVEGTIFAEDVEYVEVTDPSTGVKSQKYRLIGDMVTASASSSWNSSREALLQNHHYTCFSTTATECDQVRYYYMVRDKNNYYAPLKNGLLLDDLLNIEFDGGSTNAKKSNIHNTVEKWYINNLTNYSDYIEDTVYCNDRSLYQPWSNTTSVANTNEAKTHFGAKARVAYTGNVSVKCPYVADSFTVDIANGNGVLDYPIGLISFDEAALAGFAWGKDSVDNYLYNGGKVWWSMSPGFISATGVYIGVIYSTLDHVAVNYIGSKDANGIYSAGGVRPVISLKNNIRIEDGHGTGDDPYIIQMLENDLEGDSSTSEENEPIIENSLSTNQ